LVGDRMRQQGKLNEAQPVLQAALSLQRKLLGPEHPDLVATLRGLASTMKQEGHWAEAEAMYRETLELRRKRAGGPDAYAVSEISGLFRALREQNKLQEAEQVLAEALTPAFLSTPASVELLRQRVDFLGRQGRWKEAAADVARWIEHQPDDHYAYLMLGPLLVVTQDRSVYDALCRKAAATFTNTTNPYSGERIAVVCLLVPDSVVELSQVDRFADTAFTFGRNDSGALPFFQLCKAWSHYRLKRYREAVTLAEKCLDKTPDYNNATTCAILAMAYWQLGQPAESRALFEKGNRLLPAEMPNLVTSKSGQSWVAWLISHIALKEAKVLLSSPPAKGAGKP
jgi:tetratricopeptide (TPR) repeat protein